jgi:hypothetical protein
MRPEGNFVFEALDYEGVLSAKSRIMVDIIVDHNVEGHFEGLPAGKRCGYIFLPESSNEIHARESNDLAGHPLYSWKIVVAFGVLTLEGECGLR